MNIFNSQLPTWLNILFLLSFLAPIFMISKMVASSSKIANDDDATSTALFKKVFIFFSLFYLYVGIMSHTGLFAVNAMPPKVLIFTTLPLMLFYFGFVANTKIYKRLLNASKLSALIRLHIFRLVGVFFILAWWYGTLPKYFAFTAGFGDIFAAITAIYVANLVDAKHKHYKIAVLVWNIIGLLDILNVIFTAFFLTYKSLHYGGQGVIGMAYFPYSLIPAFAPATIVFLHISIFKKLRQEYSNNALA